MCRLFAIKANKQVDIEFSVIKGSKSFRTFGNKNPDGWGMGWYKEGKPRVKKEPLCIVKSGEIEPVATSARSEIFISHIRRATTGERSLVNCHPFQSGRWLFAHNGCVDREDLMSRLDGQYRASIQGQTDSEVYFQWLLQNIEQEESVQKGLAAALKQVRVSSFTGLNFILTDGASVYAYRDASKDAQYYSLFYLCRNPQTPGPLEFRSKEVDVLFQSKSLQEEQAILICSEKLSDEDWKEIPLGSLLSISKDMIPRLMEIK
jgi:glutamine amidotransferase